MKKIFILGILLYSLLLVNAQKTSFSDIILGNRYTIKSKNTTIQGYEFDVNLNKLKDNRVYRIYASNWDTMPKYQFEKLKESIEVKYNIKLYQSDESRSESIWLGNRNNISFKLRARIDLNTKTYQYNFSFVRIEIIDNILYKQKVHDRIEF